MTELEGRVGGEDAESRVTPTLSVTFTARFYNRDEDCTELRLKKNDFVFPLCLRLNLLSWF